MDHAGDRRTALYRLDTVQWYGTGATADDGSQIDPSMVQMVVDGQNGAADFGIVTPRLAEVTFQYFPV